MKTRFRTLILACVMQAHWLMLVFPSLLMLTLCGRAVGAGVKALDGNGQTLPVTIQAYKDQLATATGVRDIADL